MDKKIKVIILGGTGYTGAELLRLLTQHPYVEIIHVSSRKESGKLISERHPNLRQKINLRFSDISAINFRDADVVFCATPNGFAMKYAKTILDADTKLIDLAADFRLQDPKQWKKWYNSDHQCTDLLQESVYGLPELNKTRIKNARIIANPGCYPTASLLGLLPLISSKLIDTQDIIANTTSGVTGAGRNANINNLFCEITESYKAYAASGHRHHPEIQQILNQESGCDATLTFVPHLAPMLRGIHATLYTTLLTQTPIQDIHTLYQDYYKNAPFVDILPLGAHPETRTVKSANICRISPHISTASGKLVILSVIDNLTKGAAGQAIQNMNIMFNLDETVGLGHTPILP